MPSAKRKTPVRSSTSRRLTSFGRLLGISVDASESGRATASMPVAARLKNRRGVMHGGAVSTLLDTALGAAVISAMTPEEWCATVSLQIQFLAGATSGRVSARGEVVRRAKRLAFARGELVDAKGAVLATASGVWYIWPTKPPAGARPPQSGAPRDDGR